MKYDITYRDTFTKEEYTLCGIEAANYNEAVKIAKNNKGKGEEIANIKLNAASIFDDLLAAIQANFLGGLQQ